MNAEGGTDDEGHEIVVLAVREHDRGGSADGASAGHGAADGRAPLVLVHGTGADASTWDAVAAALATDRPVLAVDLRGHGASPRCERYSVQLMAADLGAFLDDLRGSNGGRTGGGRPVDVVAHSLGGLVALRAVAERPSRVRRLVLEDVGSLHPREPAPPSRPDEDPGFDWRVVEQVRPQVDSPAEDWPRVLAAVAVPVLVVAGGPRSFVPADHVTELVDTVPDGRVVTLDTGHEVHLGDPDGFVAAIRPFLAP